MKLIIAGSRTINNIKDIEAAMIESACLFHWLETPITEIVSGTAIGADRLGEQYARARAIPVKRMPADWNQYGRSAGYIRNAQMAEYADGAVVVWDGVSNGSRNMIAEMKKRNKPVYVHLAVPVLPGPYRLPIGI